MKITCDHSASSYGIPVILDDKGKVLPYDNGIRTLRLRMVLSTQQLADACGCSRRTVEGWEQGRVPEAAALNVMAALLKRPKTKARGLEYALKPPPAPQASAQASEPHIDSSQ